MISCMGGHIKSDLKATNESDFLLTCVWSMLDVVEHESLLEGAYLVVDAKNAMIGRSGKASPVKISSRWYEKHTKSAKVSNVGWQVQFPHRNNPNI